MNRYATNVWQMGEYDSVCNVAACRSYIITECLLTINHLVQKTLTFFTERTAKLFICSQGIGIVGFNVPIDTL